MDLSPINSITIGVSLVVGILIGIFLRKKIAESGHKDIEKQGRKLLEDAISEADIVRQETLLKVKDEVLVLKQDAESDIRLRNKEIKKEERKFSKKLDQIDNKIDILDKREIESLQKEKYFVKQEAKLAKKREELQNIINEQQIKLEKVAGIPKDEAKKQLMESIESEARMEAAKEVVRIENEMKIKADKKAKKILALAMARYAGDYVAERTVSIVQLPNDEMKGRIIGREGRNIRAIEAATGIDIIIDDTPEAVILSGFNPVRREVARLAMERLTTDGRIHPARIEEVVNKVAKELDVSIKETGEQATFDVGVHGLHVELIQLIGRLKYRTSYGQSVLLHSLEVAFLCGIMAAELGLDVKQAKRAGLLHDIGKAVDHEVDGSHASIGQNLAKKYGETPEIIHAIAAHHEEVEPNCILDILVQSADALSGARPGARKEMLESYVKRLEDLEAIAEGFDGVERAYAIQAGRELRVVVDSGRINDATASLLAKDVTKKIEEGLTYPGQIKVTVIRETRAVFYAK